MNEFIMLVVAFATIFFVKYLESIDATGTTSWKYAFTRTVPFMILIALMIDIN
jgi:hypothetical protein